MSEPGLLSLDTLRRLPWATVGAVRSLAHELEDRLSKLPLETNEYGFDPYGFHRETAQKLLLPGLLMYRHYFRCETYGIENVPEGRVLVVGNHAGQFAYDGAMVSMALLMEANPPRMARGMGEYFLWKVPWMGRLASRMGTMTGTPENCVGVLDREGCVMAFPEGARGANKPFHKRYQLQKFGTGFMRLALETNTPILPVGIVGSEEQQPGLANLESVGHALGLPSLPITITMPWLGPLGAAVALPVKYHIHFGELLHFEGDAHEEDEHIDEKVEVVKTSMRGLLDHGRKLRTGIFS